MSHEIAQGTKELAIANAPIENFDLADEKVAIRQVDAALQFLRTEGDVVEGEINERKLIWRIDFLVMPLMFAVYTFQYIDKSLGA